MRISTMARLAAVGGVVAGMVLSGSPASAAGPEAPVYQSRTVTNSDYLPTLYPQEGAPAYVDPQTGFRVWTTPAAGLRPIYRTYNPVSGQHALTADPNGAGRGTVESVIGYLAVDDAAARANSTQSCAPPPFFDRGYGPSTVIVYDRGLGVLYPNGTSPKGPYFTVTQRAGVISPVYNGGPVETIGYSPC